MEVEPEQVSEGVRPNPLLELLPAEMWMEVLTRIKDSKDQWNAAYSDQLFRDLLTSMEDSWTSMLLRLTLPLVEGYLDRKDVLSLRLVSTKWRKSVDHFLEEQEWRNDRIEAELEYLRLDVTNMSESDFPYHFSEAVQELRANPRRKIVAGSVMARIDNSAAMEDVNAFFREQGHKIAHLDLQLTTESLEHQSWSPVEAVEFVREILTTTPNLRSLVVRAFVLQDQELDVPYLLWKDRVAQHLEQNGLPVLPQLFSLELVFEMGDVMFAGEGAESALVSICQHYHGQLKRLFLRGINVVPEMKSSHSLVKMRLELFEVDALENLWSVKAPLEELTLFLCYQMFLYHSQLVFEILENFAGTLKDLRLVFREHGHHKIEFAECCEFPDRLELPNLEKLSLENLVIADDTSFNFLLNLTKLRKLYIDLIDIRFSDASGTPSTQGDAVKIQMKQGTPSFTNRAEKLPWLESVSIWFTHDVYDFLDSEDESDNEDNEH